MHRVSPARTGENEPSTLQAGKTLEFERKGVVKRKLNALGDLKNTLHCRPNTVNQNDGSAKLKLTPFPKSDFKKPASVKKSSGPKLNGPINPRVSPSEGCEADDDDSKCFNHFLCEEADEACINNFLSDYRFSNEEIEKIAQLGKKFKPVKIYQSAYSVPPIAKDIVAVPTARAREKIFTVDDIGKDLWIPIIPPPVAV